MRWSNSWRTGRRPAPFVDRQRHALSRPAHAGLPNACLPTIGQAADLPPGPGSAIVSAGQSSLPDRARSRPILLVVDDLRWAGQDTMEALRYVAFGSARSGLIVAIYRESEVALPSAKRCRAPSAPSNASFARVPLLSGLTLDEVNHTSNRWRAAAAAGAEPFHETDCGNRSIRELFRHLVEEARIAPPAVGQPTSVSVRLWYSAPVNQVVARRLDRLKGDRQSRLRRFLRPALVALLPLTDLRRDLLDCRRALRPAIRTLDGQPPPYGFAHSIVVTHSTSVSTRRGGAPSADCPGA